MSKRRRRHEEHRRREPPAVPSGDPAPFALPGHFYDAATARFYPLGHNFPDRPRAEDVSRTPASPAFQMARPKGSSLRLPPFASGAQRRRFANHLTCPLRHQATFCSSGYYKCLRSLSKDEMLVEIFDTNLEVRFQREDGSTPPVHARPRDLSCFSPFAVALDGVTKGRVWVAGQGEGGAEVGALTFADFGVSPREDEGAEREVSFAAFQYVAPITTCMASSSVSQALWCLTYGGAKGCLYDPVAGREASPLRPQLSTATAAAATSDRGLVFGTRSGQVRFLDERSPHSEARLVFDVNHGLEQSESRAPVSSLWIHPNGIHTVVHAPRGHQRGRAATLAIDMRMPRSTSLVDYPVVSLLSGVHPACSEQYVVTGFERELQAFDLLTGELVASSVAPIEPDAMSFTSCGLEGVGVGARFVYRSHAHPSHLEAELL